MTVLLKCTVIFYHASPVPSIISTEHKQRIERYRTEFVENMLPDEVINRLRSEFVLRPSEADKLEKKGTQNGVNKENEALLDLIIRKGEKAFIEFRKALKETGQRHLYSLLKKRICSDADAAGTSKT